MVRPFSLGLRPFIAMFAGHILLDVFGNFVVQGLNSRSGGGLRRFGPRASCSSSSSTRWSCWSRAIQAYVFAILTSLYINDAVNLH